MEPHQDPGLLILVGITWIITAAAAAALKFSGGIFATLVSLLGSKRVLFGENIACTKCGSFKVRPKQIYSIHIHRARPKKRWLILGSCLVAIAVTGWFLWEVDQLWRYSFRADPHMVFPPHDAPRFLHWIGWRPLVFFSERGNLLGWTLIGGIILTSGVAMAWLPCWFLERIPKQRKFTCEQCGFVHRETVPELEPVGR